MKRIKEHIKKVKPHRVASILAAGGIALAAFNFSGGAPLFSSPDSFVLFGSEGIALEEGTQVSSGDIGSNKNVDIQKNEIVNGNLFADRLSIDKDSSINGNASYNTLNIHKDSEILGTQTKPVQLPVAMLPDIPAFIPGTEDRTFTGTSTSNTLAPGSWRDITLERGSQLELPGGMYILRKLELKDNATLIYTGSTTVNVQFKLRGRSNVSILPGLNTKPDDLMITYSGIRPKEGRDWSEDDDQEIESEMDEKERKDYKANKIGRPAVFGNRSFLNFKLFAPKANVILRKESTMRGQILSRKIRVGKEGIISREEVFEKETNFSKIVSIEEEEFPINEILIVLVDDATFIDAKNIASSINGKITGFVDKPQIYKIEVNTTNPLELDNLISLLELQNNPFIILVMKNSIGGLNQ